MICSARRIDYIFERQSLFLLIYFHTKRRVCTGGSTTFCRVKRSNIGTYNFRIDVCGKKIETVEREHIDFKQKNRLILNKIHFFYFNMKSSAD